MSGVLKSSASVATCGDRIRKDRGTRHRFRKREGYGEGRPKPPRSTLGELEALTRAGTTWLLTLHFTRVARE